VPRSGTATSTESKAPPLFATGLPSSDACPDYNRALLRR
jgi:hypothetical protein